MTRKNEKDATLASKELLNLEATSDISNLLKKTRESKNLTLKDVAEEIKIRTTFLRNIEDDQFEKLPGNVYAVGFTRTYSSFLGLDEDLVISALKSAPGFAEVKEVSSPKDLGYSHTYKLSSIITLISILLLVALWAAFSFFGGSNDIQKKIVADESHDIPIYETIPKNQDDSEKDKNVESVSFQ
jgi:cytoskeletal protein RodZ